MKRYVEVISTCAIAALVVGPAFAQGTGGTSGGTTGPSAPTQEQRRPDGSQPGMGQPRPNQPGMSQPDTNRPGAREDVKGTRDRDAAKGQPDMRGQGMKGQEDMKGQDVRSGAGANAGQIRRIQEQLKAQGHDPGPIDGVMGPQTTQALKSYQKQENLPETGQLDQQTLGKLGSGKTSLNR